MSGISLSDFTHSKDEGNTLFRSGNFSSAISSYTAAIDLLIGQGEQHLELGVLYCNRALCQLRLDRYEQCVEDATSSLKINPCNLKALYRRAKALKQLGLCGQSLEDVRRVLKIEPHNPDALSLGESLNIETSILEEEVSTTHGRISNALSVIANASAEDKDKERASQNLFVLARESAGANLLVNSDKLNNLINLLPSLPKSSQVYLLQTLACLSKGSIFGTITVLSEVGYTLICSFLSGQDIELQNASASIILHCLNSLLLTEEGTAVSNVNLLRAEEVTKQVLVWVSIPNVAFNAREVLLESLLPTVSCPDMHSFLMKHELVKTILIISSSPCYSPEIPTFKIPSSVINLLYNFFEAVSENSLNHKSLYDACFFFVMCRIKEENPTSYVEGLIALSCIAQASPELGNRILGNENILSVVLRLSSAADEKTQLILAENIALTATSKDKAHSLIDFLPTLKFLYGSTNPQIRARALVGICKLTLLCENDDTSDSISNSFVMDCCRFLTELNEDALKRWAVEGLAFLSVSAPVKESICSNERLLHSILDLIAINRDSPVQYGAATLFVNLTNSYDKPERNPELEQLARFSGEKVPTPHVLDGTKYLVARISLLLNLNIVLALRILSSSPSVRTREQTARIFLAIVESQNNRGYVVQQGGGKCLISLAKRNSNIGLDLSAQAIAKISITSNPLIAFPGERVLEIIFPLVRLLKSKRQLQQFEALMALTNISSLGQKYCKKIVHEKGLHWIESLMFEEHDMLRRAATECMCNLVVCEEVKDLYRQDGNDRIKLLTLFSGEEDQQLQLAASGALCILSEDSQICKRILDVTQYFEVTEALLGSGIDELQFRGIYILANIVFGGIDIAEMVLQYRRGLELFEVCNSAKFSEKVQGIAKAGIDQLISYGLVKSKDTFNNLP